MGLRRLIFGTFWGVVMSAGGEAEAQIMFEDITPKSNVNVRTDIRPKGIHMEPPKRMAVPSKPSAPMPRLYQHVITPAHIQIAPIQRTNIRPKTIQMNRQTFNPMVKDNIRPQQIRTKPMNYTLARVPMNKLPPPIQRGHWAFNPALEGKPPVTIPYDTSIRLQKMPPARATMHPMAW